MEHVSHEALTIRTLSVFYSRNFVHLRQRSDHAVKGEWQKSTPPRTPRRLNQLTKALKQMGGVRETTLRAILCKSVYWELRYAI